jgi:HTH-type transcriptional regulator, sugar sensing transcriptional regulator
MIERQLLSLGLTEGEAKAYIALLRLGTATVGPIAKEAGVSSSKIYEVLHRLVEKGLASFIVKEKTRYYQPVAPTRLAEYLDRQQQSIEQSRQTLNHLLPKLEKLESVRARMHEAEVFLGVRGIKTAYELLFQDAPAGCDARFLYVYDAEHHAAIDKLQAGLLPFFKKRRIRWRGISTRHKSVTPFIRKLLASMDVRFVDFPLPCTIDIVEDKVLQFVWAKQPVAILIHSREIANSYGLYFDEVWGRGAK